MSLQEPIIWKALHFSKPQIPQQAVMLKYLKSISPGERTKLLGEMYSQWETWRNEQMLNQSTDEQRNELLEQDILYND